VTSNKFTPVKKKKNPDIDETFALHFYHCEIRNFSGIENLITLGDDSGGIW